MLNGHQVFDGGPPRVLHPPDDAVTAELMHDRNVWMVHYRPDGSMVEIGLPALRPVLGDDLGHEEVVDYLEERLRAAGRLVLKSEIGVDSLHTVIAVWTLGLPPA